MIGYRDMKPEDEHFVVSAWTQSFRTANTAGFISSETWYEVMDREVATALRRPDVRTVVAHAVDDPNMLFGFVTADTEERPPLVYYVFTKAPYRRARDRLWKGPGVARGLFAAIGVDPAMPFNFVCSTPMVRTLERKIPLARWRPLYGRFPKHERRQGR